MTISTITTPIYALFTKIGFKRGHDKLLHFAICYIVAMTLILLSVTFTLPVFGFSFVMTPVIQALWSGIILALGKEALDEYNFRKGTHPKGADFFDFFASILGAVMAIMTYGAVTAIMGLF